MDNGAAYFATVTTAGTACCAARQEKRDPQLELPVGSTPVTQMCRQLSPAATTCGEESQFHTSLIHCAMSTLRLTGFENQG